MLLLTLLTSFFIYKAEAGELLIAKSPVSVKFQGDDPIDQHLVPEICSAAVGFTTQLETDWQGMTITDPFNFAEAVIVLYVDGISTLGKFGNLQKYEVNNNEDEYITWKTIKNRIIDRYPMENNTIVRISLGRDDDVIDEIKTKHLDKNLEEDAAFLRELNDLNRYMNKVKKSIDGVPDFYWFTLKSLHQLSDLKGFHHPSTIEAREKVYESLLRLVKVYNSIYNGRVLVVALVSDASHTRRTRSITEEREDMFLVPEGSNENIYDPDYPVIFNIILWFSFALIFALLAVSVFIATMDPGRDSIIYRMTSNRMKKDS